MAEEGQKSEVSLITEEVKAAGLQVKPTIDNFLKLITDHYGKKLRFNEMTGKPEIYDWRKKEWCEWTDTQESGMRAYFEKTYSMYSQNKMQDALKIFFNNNRVNPLRDILDNLVWDGKPRVEHFLHDIMKAEDTEYVRECSRLIFAGGIHRAYRPGIGEVAELMAMTRVKEAEAVKAYITSQKDSYRPPYEKNVQTIPRRCVFIGTTNNPQFLTDKTGNRRFYPVQCHADGYKLLDNEEMIRGYIRQAWAEAVQLYRDNNLQPFAKKEVLELIRAAQEAAMEDDWRVGMIEQYLEDTKKMPGATVSVIELWHCALKEPEESKPARGDSIAITQIILNVPGWIKCQNMITTKWGRQKGFRKTNPFFPSWR